MSAFRAAVVKVDLVVAIEVRARGDSVCISIPECTYVVSGVKHASRCQDCSIWIVMTLTKDQYSRLGHTD